MSLDLPDERRHAFDWGRRVRAAVDLVDDGTFPDAPPDAPLAAQGETGEIVQTGWHEEARLPVYLVEFASGRVIGCFEHEIEAA